MFKTGVIPLIKIKIWTPREDSLLCRVAFYFSNVNRAACQYRGRNDKGIAIIASVTTNN